MQIKHKEKDVVISIAKKKYLIKKDKYLSFEENIGNKIKKQFGNKIQIKKTKEKSCQNLEDIAMLDMQKKIQETH